MADNLNTDLVARRIPYSLEAEQSVLGSVLINPECINDVAGILHEEDFYVPEHARIFSAMHELFLESKQIDVVTLLNTIVARNIYDEEKAKRYIKLIADTVPSARNVGDYARIVKEKSILRKLIEASESIAESAYSAQGEVSVVLDNAERTIYDIADHTQTKGFVHIRDLILKTYDHLKVLAEDPESLTGVKTGFSSLDRILVGMGKSDLILVGARPGMGKTSFALNIASNVARNSPKGGNKRAVCVFSLEMSNEQLMNRMLCSEALIDSYKMRTGQLDDEDWAKLASASGILSGCDIYIDDTPNITVTSMKAKLRRIKNLSFVVIDYLQLMVSEKRIDNRVQEIGDISRNLKLLAKELNVPVMVCAQLSRAPESRTGSQGKRPILSDLRDSGAIEQDADVVMFLYRDDYYDESPENANLAECIIAKNRHGDTSTVKLGWQGQHTRFFSIEQNYSGA